MKRLMTTLLLAAALLLPLSLVSAPSATAWTNVSVSVGYAPPPLIWAAQPLCPGEGYYWVPGYWGWGPYGYYWVPGAWAWPPLVGLLWTPGYWGWYDGYYWWHRGYWGRHVGFYGGIDYGYGYPGRGYEGGYWHHHHFFYNRAVLHVNAQSIRFTYRKPVEVPHRHRRISYNGGRGGIARGPTLVEQTWANERHLGLTAMQRRHLVQAQHDPAMRFVNNHGRPGRAHLGSTGDTPRSLPRQHHYEWALGSHRPAGRPLRSGIAPHDRFRTMPVRPAGRSGRQDRPLRLMRAPAPSRRSYVHRSPTPPPTHRFRSFQPRRVTPSRIPQSEHREPPSRAERSRRRTPHRPPE